MRVRRVALIVTLIASGILVCPPLVSAGASPEAKGEAQTLATQALYYLVRGEDAVDKDEKMADYQRGLDLAARAVELDEENPDAHFAIFGNKGRILLLQGVGANPISLLTVNHDLERALELNPNHSDALTAKGGLYRQLPRVLGGSLTVAETCLTKAIRINPDAVSARIELAATYREMGQPERSLPLLQKAAALAESQGKQRQLREARDLMHEIEGSAQSARF